MIRAALRLTIMAAAIPAASMAAESAPWPEASAPARPVASLPLNEETNVLRLLGSLAIKGYRFLASPLLPGRCAFHPSCSAFGLQAVSAHGLINGAIMASDRITRCHGFAALGGYESFRQDGLLHDPASRNPPPLPWLARFGF